MKKTILGIMLTLALVLALVGNVNAASVSADKTEVKAGETVAVTVSATANGGIQFDMSYPTEYFEYSGIEFYGKNNEKNVEDGVVSAMVWSTDNDVEKVTVTFTALKDTTADGETFSVSGFVADDDQALENSTVTVKVTPATPDDPTTDDPTPDDPTTDDPTEDDPTPDDPTTDDPAEGPTGSNGKPVDKIPQAGAPIYAGVVAVMVVAGAILLVRKIRK